jgi:hypothetical protein
MPDKPFSINQAAGKHISLRYVRIATYLKDMWGQQPAIKLSKVKHTPGLGR